MKNFLLTGAIITLLWGCQSSSQSSQPVAIQEPAPTPAPLFPALTVQEKQHYHDAVEDMLRHTLYRSSFNGGIIVAKNGEIVYENYVGFHDLRQKDSLNADIPFQIASTSKTMTSAAVLKLVQEGKLSLNDSVNKFFPQFPYQGITVKMLLNHRSGLPNYLNYMEAGKWPRTQQASNNEVLATLINWHPPHAYQPDRHFNYCNTNYVLLALIVEKASGLSFPEYMKKNFFVPLGMTNTFVHTMNDSTITQSYQRNGAPWTLDFSDGPYGDKNVFSTPRDLLKWDQSLYAQSIIKQPLLDSAYTPYSNEKPGIHNYGLGWRMLLLPNKKKVIYHNGHWHGFNSAFARLPEENATIIILSNKYNTNVYTTAKKLYNLFGNYDGKQDDGEE
ncbi:serine hydrolase domain-containing protein [Flavisolibacter ginsengisoli]|uniref:CubicO group peptidase, beta-lactamase class C family n=1 Tax=Flavisolibacter ginsengisoli DSM 18119 TaxID=1121884 RepID=A0A1M4WTM0_9BACT|nr:serine hydrolase domain-containing protein [Flavisolibacter ginsengisoli]SHE84651.1 CubicO group peptidase, beta-lactamase class C family [Flavisolibacter ginsengisoli DSM 18119]